MKATIVSTDQIVSVDAPKADPSNGTHDAPTTTRVIARVWEGVTEGGVKFTAYIPVLQVATKDDNSQFERELTEHKRPEDRTRRAISMRFVI